MLLAEIRRWPRSGAWTVPLLGLAFGIVQFAIIWAIGLADEWDSLISGTVMWATGLAGPAAALLLALVHMRERRARGGGTWWRPGSPVLLGLCRMLVCAAVVMVTNLLVLVPATVIGYLADPAAIPVARLLALAGVLVLGAVTLYPILDFLAARWGMAPVLIISACWTLAGVLTAELPQWMLIPPAWSVRAALPLLGTHANGIALMPDDSLITENPAIAVLLTSLTLLVFTAIYLTRGFLQSIQTSTKKGSRHTRAEVQVATTSFAPLPAQSVTRVRSTVLLGQLGSLRRTPLSWLVVVGLAIQLGVVLLWRNPAYAEGFAELAIVPVGAVLLGVIGWTSTRDAWPGIATTPYRISWIVMARLLALELILVLASVIVSVLIVSSGAEPGRTLRAGVLSLTVGWMLLVAAFWLSACYSPGVTAAFNGIGLMASLVLGAGELANSFWLYAPWAWTHTPATLGWVATGSISALAICIGFALTPLAVSALTRRAIEKH